MYPHVMSRRFWRTEQAILRAFFSSKRMLSARVLAKRAQISPSTLYRHHKNVYEIMPDLEKYMLKRYTRMIRGLMRQRGVQIKTLYAKTLIFIAQNQEVFEMIMERGCEGVIEKMVGKLLPKIRRIYQIPRNAKESLKVYENEVAGVIEVWLREGCKRPETEVLADVMYLTNTMRQRLLALGGLQC